MSKLTLTEPYAGKNWSAAGFLEPPAYQLLHKAFNSISNRTAKKTSDIVDFAAANPFFQSGSTASPDPDKSRWVMVEFWTDNSDAILAGAQALGRLIGADVVI